MRPLPPLKSLRAARLPTEPMDSAHSNDAQLRHVDAVVEAVSSLREAPDLTKSQITDFRCWHMPQSCGQQEVLAAGRSSVRAHLISAVQAGNCKLTVCNKHSL